MQRKDLKPPVGTTDVNQPASRSNQARWHLAAAAAGWLVPGLGHWFIGQRQRAVILAVTIGSLWVTGLVIGGLDVCDRQRNSAWFILQSLVAPSLAVDWYQSQLLPIKSDEDWSSTELVRSAMEPSFGHPNEQGILYTALAGLLNLLVILDVIYRDGEPGPTHPVPAGHATD